RSDPSESFRPGIGIGDRILDMQALADLRPFEGLAARALEACRGQRLNALMALDAQHWSALRLALSRALRLGSPLAERLQPLLSAQNAVQFDLPARIGDYTDF